MRACCFSSSGRFSRSARCIINAVIWPRVFERQRRLVLSSSMLVINGKIQREDDVVHLVAQRLFDISEVLGQLGEWGNPFPLPHR